jgi:hypothetical protein
MAPVFDWFTKGFDTADLKEAMGLHDEFTWRPFARPARLAHVRFGHNSTILCTGTNVS